MRYILYGEIQRGPYKGVYKLHRQGMEAIFNMGVFDAIVINANNISHLKQVFAERYNMILKGNRLGKQWELHDIKTQEFLGSLIVIRE